MSVVESALVEVSICVAPVAASPAYSAADPGCQVSEVTRLLWTLIIVAAAAGIAVVLRPSWSAVAGLATANVVWLWIDMEGPVLVSRGTHGVHLADIPVAISLPAMLIGITRLLAQRGARGSRGRG